MNEMAQEAVVKKTRRDRDSWLQTAMDVLAQEGQAKLRVDSIARSLGVTKGSFYHHFESREDFVKSIVSYWIKNYNYYGLDAIDIVDISPEQSLLELARLIEREALNRYDIAFRSWAAQEPDVAEEVHKVDAARYQLIQSLFEEIGFSGPDLHMRVQLWLVFAASHRSVHVPDPGEDPDAALCRRHAFLIARSGS